LLSVLLYSHPNPPIYYFLSLKRSQSNSVASSLQSAETISAQSLPKATRPVTETSQHSDIQAFSKEKMNCLRALLNSTKPLGSCGLTMKGKSIINISSFIPQSI
ncbi:hypothetical protein CR513_08173, partial [Mucuna pruriens]